MIDSKDFTEALVKNNLGPIVEVPCSYLKDFLNYLWSTKKIEVINPVNEAVVMGVASGFYLSSGKIPIVAMQNSGLMNTLNALTSLNQIYEIPVFMMITWRGEGGKGKDAPEHDITGKKLKKILKTFDLPYETIEENKFKDQIKKLSQLAKKTKKPVALIIKKNTFKKYHGVPKDNNYEMTRFEAIKIIKETITNSIFISTTGYPTRDSFTAKDTKDFYVVGSMGHVFSIGLGVSQNTRKKVVILDGDGSSLMHLGGLASFNPKKNRNILYFVLDNESYESTGGQPTVSVDVDFGLLAKSFGFKNFFKSMTKKEFKKVLNSLQSTKEAAFIHVKVNNEEKSERKRVSDKYTCFQIKDRFMENMKNRVSK